MNLTSNRSILNVLTDFLASDPTSEEIIGYRLPDDLQARAHELLDRNGEGELTFDEHQEMLDFMRLDEMMALLKAKTRLKLRKALNGD
jgi:hypothetical protein